MKITSNFPSLNPFQGRSQTPIGAGTQEVSDRVEISPAASSGEPGKAKGLGRMGKALAVAALVGVMLGTSGCAVYGGYGYGGNGYEYYQTYPTYSVPGYGYSAPNFNYGGHGCVGNSWGGSVCY